tara:strand:+ start:14516 stop:15115 length:600 start_codon:yes stop_codon:yes gene_type:complete
MNQTFYIKGVAVTDNTFPYKTGQTTSYATDDDGDIEFGRGSSWTTLDADNPHGNTTRFLDELGGTSFAAGILVDWAHADYVNELVLMWSTSHNGSDINWATALSDVAASTLGGFSDWVLPNIQVMRTIENQSTSRGLNYVPFSEAGNVRFWTSTTWNGATSYALALANRPVELSGVTKTTSANLRHYQVRVATFAEAGI